MAPELAPPPPAEAPPAPPQNPDAPGAAIISARVPSVAGSTTDGTPVLRMPPLMYIVPKQSCPSPHQIYPDMSSDPPVMVMVGSPATSQTKLLIFMSSPD